MDLGNPRRPIWYLEPAFQYYKYIPIFSVTFSTFNTFSKFVIHLIPLELPFYPALQVSLSNTVLHFRPTLLPIHNMLLINI